MIKKSEKRRMSELSRLGLSNKPKSPDISLVPVPAWVDSTGDRFVLFLLAAPDSCASAVQLSIGVPGEW